MSYRSFYGSNKVVADGGVSYYVDHFVTARVAKYSYGLGCYRPYNGADPENMKRRSSIWVDVRGVNCLSNQFAILLPKVRRRLIFRCLIALFLLSSGTEHSSQRDDGV